MGNDHEASEAHEDGLTPRCGYCGTPLVGMDDRALYCSRRCKELAREKRKRDRERVDTYRATYPDVAETLRTFDDYAQDDEDPQDQDDNATDTFGHLLAIHEAEQEIWARYERLMKPYVAAQRRNPGVRLPGLVALERERDQELAGLTNTGDVLTNTDRATEARRINEARERRAERAALQALGNALPGHRSGHVSYRGRETHDLWAW